MSSADVTKGNAYCENCQKGTKVDIEIVDDCKAAYAAVEDCMKREKGQIVPCSAVWDDFRLCRKRVNQK